MCCEGGSRLQLGKALVREEAPVEKTAGKEGRNPHKHWRKDEDGRSGSHRRQMKIKRLDKKKRQPEALSSRV